MKALCNKCEGEGLVPDIAERVFTVGLSWLFDALTQSKIGWLKCPKCKGKGYIKL